MEIKNIKVSVCITGYNVGRYIEQTIISLLNQKTNFAFEILIGEDLSKDNTKEVIELYASKYPDVIRTFYATENKGYSANLLNLYNNARGEYLAQIDGDDIVLSEHKLQLMVDFMDAHKDYGVCIHNYEVVDENNKVVVEQYFSNDYLHKETDTFFTLAVAGGMGMLRRSALPPKLPQWLSKAGSAVDHAFFHLAAYQTKTAYLPDKLMSYRRHSKSMTEVLKNEHLYERDIFICRNFVHYFSADKRYALAFKGGVAYYSYLLSYIKLSKGKIPAFLYHFIYAQIIAPTFSIRAQKDYMHTASEELFYKLKRIAKF